MSVGPCWDCGWCCRRRAQAPMTIPRFSRWSRPSPPPVAATVGRTVRRSPMRRRPVTTVSARTRATRGSKQCGSAACIPTASCCTNADCAGSTAVCNGTCGANRVCSFPTVSCSAPSCASAGLVVGAGTCAAGACVVPPPRACSGGLSAAMATRSSATTPMSRRSGPAEHIDELDDEAHQPRRQSRGLCAQQRGRGLDQRQGRGR